MKIARIRSPHTGQIVSATSEDGKELHFGSTRIGSDSADWEVPTTGVAYGVILNDAASRTNFGASLEETPYKGSPKAPILYIKPLNTHVGHQATVYLPSGAKELAVAGSLGIVFAQTTSRVSADKALDNVGGYTIAIDLSIPHDSVYRPAIREKCFDGALPLGPFVVGPDVITDPHAVTIRTYINDKLVAETGLTGLTRPIPQLIADISDFMSFLPDQILLPATPSGAGSCPIARAGDKIAVEIDQIGRLEITLASAGA